ncbi:MAG: fumarylacetoacetate hydrolase family protein [Chloroflexota bacterium]|nr:fumarylacetoacetate hydrolase family protein [Chloroflexota bacterium]MDE2908895.1 fumarylacetoacetate hydrolase family protein [Chloroflexota bacterium]
MKLLTYDTGTGPRCGVLQDNQVVDVSALLGVDQTLIDLRALLELGDSPIDRVRDAVAGGVAAPGVPLNMVRLRAPVLQPPTVRDFFSFEGHASGQGTRTLHEAWYRLPVFYFSNTLRIFGPEDEVPFPSATNRLDYELELGCVIGRGGSDIAAADGLDYIAGFCIFNDFSARDLQFDEMAVGLGPAKGKDATTSIGPWLVTTDEMAPYLRDGKLRVKCTVRVNGDVWLDGGDGGAAYFSWGDFVERASKDSRIAPGDVLGSGTVSGGSIPEAIARDVQGARYLQPGDVIELEVEGIGVLRNTLGPQKNVDPAYRFKPKA